MAHSFSNKQVEELLRNVAAVYQLKGKNQFKVIAYEKAADSIQHSTSDLKSLWEAGQLDNVAGLGESLRGYLDELFKTGKVKHFEELFEGINKNMFAFLNIAGVGPKTAEKLADAGVKNIDDLSEKIKDGSLLKKGFSEKVLKGIEQGISELSRKSDRLLLPVAESLAQEIIAWLEKSSHVKKADTLGSLRRKVATVGDIDISVASQEAKKVIEHFSKFPGAVRLVEAGEKTATISLNNGLRVDLLVQPPELYGNLLQHFTGGKNHNIKIRSWALKKGFSVSDNGLKEVKSGKLHKFTEEKGVYDYLKLEYPVPELREDTGEFELSFEHKLPELIELSDIKGDLHTHSLWTDGKNTISEMAKTAAKKGYDYIALTDHSYPNMDYNKRIKEIEQLNYSYKDIRVIKGLEVNINVDATLQIPDEILEKHDFVLVSIHTSFRQAKEDMTERILTALENPHVDAFAHPTGRLLLEREGIEADWPKIFKFAADNGKILEINAFPNRTDLPDLLIREAKKYKARFSIDTDSHQTHHLELMEYGIFNAKRGWVTKEEVINTLSYSKLKDIITTLQD
ncbi:MAG TPA: DNA polymerase/3'-5' exonuclease PolX [Candidatus Saccharimonadales bacterium]|nr:DNA polymerase/3'-5' exonuclease PolX [Candidatus Saccharimonadales bacterium]